MFAVIFCIIYNLLLHKNILKEKENFEILEKNRSDVVSNSGGHTHTVLEKTACARMQYGRCSNGVVDHLY